MTHDPIEQRLRGTDHRSDRRPGRGPRPGRGRGPRRRGLRHHRQPRRHRCWWRPPPPGSCAWPSSARTTTRCSASWPSGSARGCSRRPARLDEVRRELDEYFAGPPRPLRAARSTGACPAASARRCSSTLYADVDYGRTVSYLELATHGRQPEGQPRPSAPPWPPTPSRSSSRATGCCAPAASSAATAAASPPRSAPRAGEGRGELRPVLSRASGRWSEDEGAVVAAEAEAVAQGGAGLPGAGLAHDEVDRRELGVDLGGDGGRRDAAGAASTRRRPRPRWRRRRRASGR